MTAVDWTPSTRELERRRIRRAMQWRRGAIASLAATVVFGALIAGIWSSPGFPTVRETFFSIDDAQAAWPAIVKGFGLNVAMFLIAEPLILLLGAAIAIVRGTTSAALFPVRVLAIAYTDLLRGVPTILLVFLLAFGMPALNLTGVPTSLFFWAVTALVLSYGAYVAEVFRAGIESVHPSQVNSAKALALSDSQTMRHVVLPQAVRRVVPPLLNDFVSLQKDTALAGAVGVFEGLFAARDYANFNFNFTPYLVTAALFIGLTIPLARLTDWLGRRASRRMQAGAR